MKRLRILPLTALLAMLGTATPIHAQSSDQFLGQMMLVGFNFCPRGWSDASGQLLSIAQNTALFSLLGTTYGGDGQTTFALPNLNGRVIMHVGTGPGLPEATQGEVLGAPSTTMSLNQMPRHFHGVLASSGTRATNTPAGNSFPTFEAPPKFYVSAVPDVTMAAGTIGTTGSGTPFSQYQPSLVLRYCVATQGIFPSRN